MTPFRTLLWSLTLAATAVAQAGCMSTRVAAPGTDGEVAELELRPGDRIQVVTTRRQRYTIELNEIGATAMVGVTVEPHKHDTLPAGHRVQVPYEELALLEVRRFSPARTAGAVAGGVLVVGLVGLLVVGPPLAWPAPQP
jgi:hypothetical protein